MKNSFLPHHMSWDNNKSETVSPLALRGASIKERWIQGRCAQVVMALTRVCLNGPVINIQLEWPWLCDIAVILAMILIYEQTSTLKRLATLNKAIGHEFAWGTKHLANDGTDFFTSYMN